MRDTLKTIPGVSDVDVDFQKKLATFQLDTKKSSAESVAEQLSAKTKGRYKASVVKEKT